jgi:hypothetical protein
MNARDTREAMMHEGRHVMRYAVIAIIGAILMTACDPDILTKDKSDTYIRISDIVGVSGHDDEEGDFILSDVDPVFNDNVTLTIEAYSKNLIDETSSFLKDVTLEQYDIRYVRADGHNIEGVDVPYGISGKLTQTIFVGGNAEIGVVVVRHQAKIEPPLKNIGTGGLELLRVDALITVYGRTGAGDVVKAEASIMINFANYSND